MNLKNTIDLHLGRALQGRLKMHGLDISIEHAKGSVRKGKDKDGNEWSTTMQVPYGYIRKTKGLDGEHVDCYVGPIKNSKKAFVVNQNKADGKLDEHKIMLGFPTASAAKSAYLKHVPEKFFGSMEETTIPELKERLQSMKGKIKASGGPETVSPPMTYFEMPLTFTPPSSKDRPVPVPDVRETDNSLLDVTQREDQKTKDFRSDLLNKKARPVHLTTAISPGRSGSTATGGSIPFMALSKQGKKK